ncbi:MAG: GNAT family N-acetyltransferase [Bdellovibrio sp.]
MVADSIVEIRRLTGEDLQRELPALARLRIEVFRDFPYLYEGSMDYEQKYLEVYLRSSRCAMIAAYDQQRIVGAASALPLSDENDYVQEPFLHAGYDLKRIFYFGESVLLPSYRGQGLGHAFFDRREEVARSYGDYDITCFCAVQRSERHPQRPSSYRSLESFWTKRGYASRAELQAEFTWRDVGDQKETAKKMTYWLKEW